MISAYMMLNPINGVIVSSMVEMKKDTEENQAETKAWAVANRLKQINRHKSMLVVHGGFHGFHFASHL